MRCDAIRAGAAQGAGGRARSTCGATAGRDRPAVLSAAPGTLFCWWDRWWDRCGTTGGTAGGTDTDLLYSLLPQATDASAAASPPPTLRALQCSPRIHRPLLSARTSPPATRSAATSPPRRPSGSVLCPSSAPLPSTAAPAAAPAAAPKPSLPSGMAQASRASHGFPRKSLSMRSPPLRPATPPFRGRPRPPPARSSGRRPQPQTRNPKPQTCIPLPQAVVRRLLNGETDIADEHERCTVLFAGAPCCARATSAFPARLPLLYPLSAAALPQAVRLSFILWPLVWMFALPRGQRPSGRWPCHPPRVRFGLCGHHRSS